MSFAKKSASAFIKYGVMASHNISLPMAKKGQSHGIGDELIIPSVMEQIETVMKEDFSSVLNCLSLGNSTVQRHLNEIALDSEKTLTSELA